MVYLFEREDCSVLWLWHAACMPVNAIEGTTIIGKHCVAEFIMLARLALLARAMLVQFALV